MSGQWADVGLPGVWRQRQTSHPDERGSFTELWRSSWLDTISGPGGEPMRQANLSRSKPRVLRGLHLHRNQADLWVVVEGRAFVALVDVRPALVGGDGPPGAVGVATLEAEAGDALYLPAGVAHGFYAATGLSLVYLVNQEYDGTDEHGFVWNDPMAGVEWPDPDPIVSARDAAAPSLAELIRQLRA